MTGKEKAKKMKDELAVKNAAKKKHLDSLLKDTKKLKKETEDLLKSETDEDTIEKYKTEIEIHTWAIEDIEDTLASFSKDYDRNKARKELREKREKRNK